MLTINSLSGNAVKIVLGTNIMACAKIMGIGQACDYKKSRHCPTQAACNNQGVCINVTKVAVGQSCNSQVKPPVICQIGHTCVGFGTGRNLVCLKMCIVNNPSCPAGFECKPMANGSNQGACIQTKCLNDSSCLYTNHQCIPTKTGEQWCVTAGPVGFGGVCSSTSSLCQAKYTCINLQGSTNGICLKDCKTNPVCPASGYTTSCVAVTTTMTLCLFKCTTNANCPAGTTCKKLKQGNFCFP